MQNEEIADWESVLSSAARLQHRLPGAVLAGGTAAAVFANHRFSRDADHILPDLRSRFDAVLADLADHLGSDKFRAALHRFDEFYPQPNNESALLQLQIQLAEPLPYDLEENHLDEYKNLRKDWTDWSRVRQVCIDLALTIFDFLAGGQDQDAETGSTR